MTSAGRLRILRSAWVLVANVDVVYLTFSRGTAELRLESALEAIIPVLGIVLELTGVKFARLVNVGYFTVAGLYFCEETLRYWSNPYSAVLLILALGLLVTAALTEGIYRKTTGSGPEATVP